jgi:hypothetical protein
MGGVHGLPTDVTKTGQEPDCGHENALFSGRTIYVRRPLQVDAAKSELKADILMLDSKVVKKIQRHERRITNIEEQEGIENPEKN